MCYKACIYNTYGYRTSPCSGFHRHSETKPHGDPMVIVGSPQPLCGDHTEHDFSKFVNMQTITKS